MYTYDVYTFMYVSMYVCVCVFASFDRARAQPPPVSLRLCVYVFILSDFQPVFLACVQTLLSVQTLLMFAFFLTIFLGFLNPNL